LLACSSVSAKKKWAVQDIRGGGTRISYSPGWAHLMPHNAPRLRARVMEFVHRCLI
jgi:hypothetical protein